MELIMTCTCCETQQQVEILTYYDVVACHLCGADNEIDAALELETEIE